MTTPPNHQSPLVASDGVAERFAEKMRALELGAKEHEVEQHARELGVEYISLHGFPIGPETLTTIPQAQSEELSVICFLNTGTEIRVGAVHPDQEAVRELVYQLGERHQADARVYAISEQSFAIALKRFDALPKVRLVTKTVTITEADISRLREELGDLAALGDRILHVSTTDLVTLILAGAIEASSSDIHIESEETAITLRYRIDGILRNVATIPKERWKELIGRVKLLAGLKLNVADIPQDGRISIASSGGAVDIRVSTLPTTWGESIVMRLLMPTAVGLAFDQLGVRGNAAAVLAREIERPNGMILTTGPTGSGKTTTLYAILQKLNTPGTKIITLEDPVEYKIKGLNQSQINPSHDYTFAKGLRAILRQDPDVVMIGEIRDLETAEIAVQAALTGHLVLSTVHTNSAAGAIPRLLSMGVKPFLLAPALNAVIGQRLARRLREDTRIPATLSNEQSKKIHDILETLPPDERASLPSDPSTFFTAPQTPDDPNGGYKGRVGIYEVLGMSPEVEKIILSGNVSEYEMQNVAAAAGMITMAQDGILKALDGITSLDEVFRVAE
jgi:type IV pilus assembly protein PilB